MASYSMSFAQSVEHEPHYPSRTAYKTMAGDIVYREWPSRAAMLKTIQMQGKRAPRSDDWREWSKSSLARRAPSSNKIDLQGGYSVHVVKDGDGFRARLISEGVGVIMEPQDQTKIGALLRLAHEMRSSQPWLAAAIEANLDRAIRKAT